MKPKLFKTFFSLAILLFLFLQAYPQFTVDAGKDTTFCISMYPDSIYLGDNISIKNGIEPYTIAWECKAPKGEYDYYTASDFSNDSTAVSPYIEGWYSNGKWIKFILHVTDSENNYAKDTINVRFSTFVYLTGYSVVELEKGDSILFNSSSIGGGIAPLTFHWQPTIGLTNPDTLVTWCKTDSLTQWRNEYNVVATDSCGCVSKPNIVYEIWILPTDVREIPSENESLNIKQIGNDIHFNNHLNNKAYISLFSLNGKLLYKSVVTDNRLNISQIIQKKGMYIVRVSIGNKVATCKFLNE